MFIQIWIFVNFVKVDLLPVPLRLLPFYSKFSASHIPCQTNTLPGSMVTSMGRLGPAKEKLSWEDI